MILFATWDSSAMPPLHGQTGVLKFSPVNWYQDSTVDGGIRQMKVINATPSTPELVLTSSSACSV